MERTSIGGFAVRVTEGGRERLGFDTGLGNRVFASVNLRELRDTPGWIITDTDAEPWKGEELREAEGSMILLGPWKPGRGFDPSADTSPEIFIRLARVLAVLQEKDSPLEHFVPAALYLCDDGAVIVFPPLFTDFVLNQLTAGGRLLHRDPWCHPLFRGAKGRAWSLAALSYRALSGENPFYGNDEAEIRDRIREHDFLRTTDAVPGIKKYLAGTIDAALAEEEPDNLPGPEEWAGLLARWKEEGATRPLGEEERNAFDNRRTKARKRLDSRFGFKRKLTAKGVTWLVSALVGAALLFLAGTIAVSALQPPLTRGMDPDQVIRAYYDGINTLNYPLVMDCLGSGALDEDAATVKQEHIMAIQRTKQFGDSGIIRAEDWLAEGQPPIPPFKILFGLTGFQWSEDGSGRTIVTYFRWYTDLGDGFDTAAGNVRQQVTLTGLKVTDTLTLEQKGKDWEIARIDRSVSPHYAREVVWSEGGSFFQD